MTNLYFIRDKISGVIVSAPVPALNDGVALNGFRHFCDEQEKNGLSKNMYELLVVGSFNDKGSFVLYNPDGSPSVIADGEHSVDAFNNWCKAHFEEDQ